MKFTLIILLGMWLSLIALLSMTWGPALLRDVGDSSKWPVFLVWGLVIAGSNFVSYLRGFYAGREL